MLSSIKNTAAAVSSVLILSGCDSLSTVAFQQADRDDLNYTYIASSDISDDGQYVVYTRGGEYYVSVEDCEPNDPNEPPDRRRVEDPNTPQDPNDPEPPCEITQEPRNWNSPIYVYDFQTKETTEANVNSAGEPAIGVSQAAVISGNGRVVAFSSDADNLVEHDNNGNSDIFVHDLATGQTSRVSINSAGEEADDYSVTPVISEDGNIVAFLSAASNLSPLNHHSSTLDVYVHNRTTGITQLASANSDGTPADRSSYRPTLSGDGRFVAFHSSATNLLATGTPGIRDVFLHDTQTGTTTQVNKDSAGLPGNYHSSRPALSFDGRFTAFETTDGFDPADTQAHSTDIYVHDRVSGQTQWVSAFTGDGGSKPSISDDGRYVAFSNIVYLPPGNYEHENVWIYDRQTGITREASLTSFGEQATGESRDAKISGNGRYVIFEARPSHYSHEAINDEPTVFARAVPGLEITGVTPNEATIGGTTSLTITGSGFDTSTGVSMDAPVSNLVVVDENTITFDVTIPDTDVAGTRDITVILPGTGAGAVTGSTAQCAGCVNFIEP